MTGCRRQRVIDGIRARIAAGELRPGDQLPSIKQLTEIYAPVSAATVVNALRELQVTGEIRGWPGVGTFVAEPGDETR